MGDGWLSGYREKFSAILEPPTGPLVRQLRANDTTQTDVYKRQREFFRDFLPLVAGHDRDEIVVCPPYTDVDAAMYSAKGSNVAIGVQNVHLSLIHI